MRSTRVVALVLAAACASCGGAEPAPPASAPPATSVQVGAATTPAPIATTPPPTSVALPATYTVQAGDSLFAIAETLCVSVDDLIAANAWPEGADHPIFPGDELAIPADACLLDESAPASVTPTAATPTADGGLPCQAEPCLFPYGDPGDYGAVYADGACSDIRTAWNEVFIGPDTVFLFAPAPGKVVPDSIPEQAVRDEAAALWSAVIDAYGGLGDVPEDVTTSLGRAGAIEGETALAYIAVLIEEPGPIDDAWNDAYTDLQVLLDRRDQNLAPIRSDLDARCPAIAVDG